MPQNYLCSLDMADLRYESRLRANVVESLKAASRFSKHSWERRKAAENLVLARKNLKDVLDEIESRRRVFGN